MAKATESLIKQIHALLEDDIGPTEISRRLPVSKRQVQYIKQEWMRQRADEPKAVLA